MKPLYTPWLNPWLGMLKSQFSGDVSQDINPVTSWFSPQFDFNFAGNRRIESDVVSDVASYGKQLGILSEAVLELAEGKKGDAFDELQQLAKQVEDVKQQHKDKLEQQVKTDLEQLKKYDPEALERVLDELGLKGKEGHG